MSHIKHVPDPWDEFLDLLDVDETTYAAKTGQFVRVNATPDGLEFTADVVQKSGSTMTNFLTLHADPTSNLHAATKQYVDSVAQGLDFKESVLAASVGNLTLVNEQTVDGVALVAGDRVLVKDQTAGEENGIYIVVDAGAWSRSADADTSAEVNPGMFVFVEEGTVNADTGWVLSTDATITLGTTELVFIQFSGAGTYTAGNGLTLGGSEFAADFEDTDGNIPNIGTQDAGTSNKVARADHVHAHGDQAGGSLHADVIAGGADGFMTGSDKTKLDLYLASFTGGGFLMSNAGGTAMEENFHTATQGDILFAGAGGTWGALGTGTAGQVLSSGGAGADLSWEDVATTFVGLTDVDEADYTGHGGWLVRVNSAPDGLEFANLTGVPSTSTLGYTLYWDNSIWAASGIIFNDHANAEVGINTQTPNATLHVNGSLSAKIHTVTGDYDMDTGTNADIYSLLCNNTGADNTVTLPAVAGTADRVYVIKKISANTYKTTLATTGAETIDGAADYEINYQYESVTVISDGSNWFIV